MKSSINAMPSMDLTDQEVADVMNYVMSSWSNKQTKKILLQ
jgi:mono/diheme cytochrome c family protein